MTVPSRGAQKGFVAAIVIFAVVTVVGGFYLINALLKVDALSTQNRIDQQRGHAARLADQARTDAEVKQLACGQAAFLLTLHSTDKRVLAYLDSIERTYRCPPPPSFSTKSHVKRVKPAPRARVATATPAPHSHAGGGAFFRPDPNITPPPQYTHPPHSTRPSPAPHSSPAPTPTPTVIPTPSPAAPVCVPGLICITLP